MRGWIAALLVALLAAETKAEPACYRVHGRLFAANGTPSLRIWPVGTRRMLGVHDDANPEALPPELRGDRAPSMGATAADRVEVYGDFTVCPLTRDRPGHMRMVTVKAVEHPTWVRGER
jgi:hypothetical protein